MRRFFAMEKRGELKKGTARRWAHHTPNIKKLPERVRKRKHNPPTKGNYLGGVVHRSNRIAW